MPTDEKRKADSQKHSDLMRRPPMMKPTAESLRRRTTRVRAVAERREQKQRELEAHAERLRFNAEWKRWQKTIDEYLAAAANEGSYTVTVDMPARLCARAAAYGNELGLGTIERNIHPEPGVTFVWGDTDAEPLRQPRITAL